MTDRNELLVKIVSRSAIYVPTDCEGIRIDYWETECEEGAEDLFLYGTGEESGENYQIGFNDIDLDKDLFYELKLVDPASL